LDREWIKFFYNSKFLIKDTLRNKSFKFGWNTQAMAGTKPCHIALVLCPCY